MIIRDYTDDRGIQRRVRLQNSHDPPQEGIPIDVFDRLDTLYSDTPDGFRRELYRKLWARGLITAADFNKQGAAREYRRALQSTLAREAHNAIEYVKE